jgi:hypothetical protein
VMVRGCRDQGWGGRLSGVQVLGWAICGEEGWVGMWAHT